MTSSTTAVRSKWREALDYFLWFYTPFKPMSASDIYELVSTNAYSGKGLYLNLGYWKTARTIDEACVDMAMSGGELRRSRRRRQGRRCRLRLRRPGHAVDGAPGPRAHRRPQHHHLAGQAGARAGAGARPRRPHRPARRLGDSDAAADATFDKVVGVECAFHFDTREAFFHEAQRVLKPGGRLALADVIMGDPDRRAFQRRIQRFNWNFFMKKYAVPQANADTKETYAAKLRAAGFTNVSVRSIRHEVYPGLHAFMASDKSMLKRFHWLARLPYYMTPSSRRSRCTAPTTTSWPRPTRSPQADAILYSDGSHRACP